MKMEIFNLCFGVWWLVPVILATFVLLQLLGGMLAN